MSNDTKSTMPSLEKKSGNIVDRIIIAPVTNAVAIIAAIISPIGYVGTTIANTPPIGTQIILYPRKLKIGFLDPLTIREPTNANAKYPIRNAMGFIAIKKFLATTTATL